MSPYDGSLDNSAEKVFWWVQTHAHVLSCVLACIKLVADGACYTLVVRGTLGWLDDLRLVGAHYSGERCVSSAQTRCYD